MKDGEPEMVETLNMSKFIFGCSINYNTKLGQHGRCWWGISIFVAKMKLRIRIGVSGAKFTTEYRKFNV